MRNPVGSTLLARQGHGISQRPGAGFGDAERRDRADGADKNPGEGTWTPTKIFGGDVQKRCYT